MPDDTVALSVSFTVPAAGATLTPGTQVLLTVIANDNVGVAGFMFTNGATGEVLGQSAKNGSTYTLPCITGAAGPLSLVATATAGNSQSATVDMTVSGTTTTPPTDLTAALAISLTSVMLSSPVAFTVTDGVGTSPYAYEVVATDNATGQKFTLGTASSGIWPLTAAGSYSIGVINSSVPTKRARPSRAFYKYRRRPTEFR